MRIEISGLPSTLVGVGILAFGGFLYWLFKTGIPRYIEGRIKFGFDKAIEERRHELGMLAKEREIRFSRFHERQAEAIADIYAKLRMFEFHFNEYIKEFRQSGERSQVEDGKDAADANRAFYLAFSTKLIFVSRETGDKLNAINRRFVELGTRYQVALRVDALAGPLESKRDMWESIDRMKAGIPPALDELADHFRSLIAGEELPLEPKSKA